MYDGDIPQDNLEICDALHFLPAEMGKQLSLKTSGSCSKPYIKPHVLQISSYS